MKDDKILLCKKNKKSISKTIETNKPYCMTNRIKTPLRITKCGLKGTNTVYIISKECVNYLPDHTTAYGQHGPHTA
jgi:hypothetical protein